ncbi:unnamed protein product, partial [Rotaria magnacalcarata]
MVDKYENKTYEEVFYMPDTVNKLDKNKVYDQETSGEFREVHPKSYGNWYSRCCQHEYQTECYIPLVCGKTRFCGNLDSGSTCSVLSMTVANKLFKEGTLKKLYDTKINLVGAGGISQLINTRIVTADISMGTARLSGVKFILLPDDMMVSCAIIGNEILSLKGMQVDFGTRIVQFNNYIIIELARLKHPRFYSHRHAPPVENKFVLPVNTEPYIKSLNPEADKEFDAIFNKISQDFDDRPEFTLEHFINDLDLEHLQSSNKELRNLKKIMQYPDFKLPNYLSHYNHIKNKLSIVNNIIYFTKEPYPPVPLLPTNCIISMALRIHDKYSHCGRDKLVDWIRTIAYHVKLSELLNKI